MGTYLDLAPCLFFSCLNDGTLIDVNEKLCKKLGYAKQELLGQKVDLIFTVATRIFQQTHLFPLLKLQGHADEIFITLVSKNKEQIPVLLNAERKADDERIVILYVGIIVNNRKKFEDELVAAKKTAEKALNENTALVHAKQQLQKHLGELDEHISLVNRQNEELRQFNRVVTHDLQEPLRKLFVFISMIPGRDEKEGQIKTIHKIKRVSEQMRSIVSGLQQYIWLTETPKRDKKVRLDEVLVKVKQQLEQEFPDVGLELETENLIPIHADPEQMSILFYQLLSNAIRFRKTGDKSYVKVSANSLFLNKFQNIVGKYEYIEYVKLQVKDNGTGFANQYKEQVFELFKRLHPMSGLGIGLSLCKKIVDIHHGDIAIDSKEGGGTNVTILLPMNQVE